MTRLLKKIATVPSLTREYNVRGRHPLHGMRQPQVHVDAHAGNVRFGVPLAAVAVLAGALSYGLVERPAPYQALHPQNEVSAIALSAMEPAAGLPRPEPLVNADGELVVAPKTPRPPSNRNLLTVSDLQNAEVVDIDEADIEEIYDDSQDAGTRTGPVMGGPSAAQNAVSMDKPYYDERKAAAVPYQSESVAHRYVSVERNAPASDYQAMIASAERALETGRYDAAMEMYETLRQRNPRDMRALMGLAVAQQRYGLDEAAVHTYESVLALDPNNTDATVNMLGLMQNVRPEEAYGKLSSMWTKNSQSPGIAAQLGLIAAQLGKGDEAMRYIGIAASLEPNNANHLYNMAVITDRAGSRGRAIELYEKALEIDATYGASRSVPRDMIYDRLYYLRRSS